MDDGEDGGPLAIVGLIIFVCCAISCILCLLKWASPSETSSSIFDLSALANWKPFNPDYINTGPETNGGGASVYGFKDYKDFRANPIFKLGSLVTGKTLDGCSSLCQTTPGCRGFTTDGGCQLYNNVTILDRNKGSVIYASQDVGAVEYLHVPYGATSLAEEIAGSPFTGTLADTVGKCHTSKSACGGFVYSGNTGKMYPAITAIDATTTGDSYMDIDHPPHFIREGNYSYGTGSSSQWTSPASWLLTMNGASGLPTIPTNNTDWFAIMSSPGFDAGLDRKGPNFKTANTITVSSLSQCQDACIGNAWCQSFTYGGNSCYMRHDRTVEHFPLTVDGGGACTPISVPLLVTTLSCTCGYDWEAAACVGYTPAHDGNSGTGNTTYVKKLYPLDVSCPMSCAQAPHCILATNDATTCNQYNDAPPQSERTPSSTLKATWMFDNYPN